MNENYVYPVQVSEVDGQYEIILVDFEGCVTYADNKTEIVDMAQDLIAITILDYESRKEELPKPSENLNNALYIQVWMPYFRSRTKEIYIKKTLTIPRWLDILAKNNNINFSSALVRGVKEELGID